MKREIQTSLIIMSELEKHCESEAIQMTYFNGSTFGFQVFVLRCVYFTQ